MDREQAKQYVKERIAEYLEGKGIDTSKPFPCLNPGHLDKKPSMSLDRKRNKAHCFACHVDYDTFDLIGLDYNLTEPAEIFQKAYEIYSLQVDGHSPGPGPRTRLAQNKPKSSPSTHTHTQNTNVYIQKAQARLDKTDYPQRRGISAETAKRYGLGYDPGFKVQGATWRALIIPTEAGSYVARNTNPDAEDRYRNRGPAQPFNAAALDQEAQPVFIVEGELDALAILEAGGQAIGLGSTANYKKLLERVKEKRPAVPLILALDNDTSGGQTADQLAKGLEEMEITYFEANIAGDHKDPNAALLADREAFAAAVRRAEKIETEIAEAKRAEYLATCAASYVDSFLDGIHASANTPAIPTGFPRLDDKLGGGLYEGLYIMGAVTSLGKTTYILQVADQIAQAGHDVIYFSLEMARYELMAKSISRLTVLRDLEENKNTRNAKTARGITTGSRYTGYSKVELELIKNSTLDYAEYAKRLYIHEGVGDIGVERIRRLIKDHIAFTGNKPVVFIDYLQIMAPYSDRMSDKQNTDKAVLELKRISRDFKIPVIAVSSLNRQSYRKPTEGKAPQGITMEAFKESGAIEYSSDVLIGLQYKGADQANFDLDASRERNPREIDLKILKYRNGPTGKVPYVYYPLFNLFKEEKDLKQEDEENPF